MVSSAIASGQVCELRVCRWSVGLPHSPRSNSSLRVHLPGESLSGVNQKNVYIVAQRSARCMDTLFLGHHLAEESTPPAGVQRHLLRLLEDLRAIQQSIRRMRNKVLIGWADSQIHIGGFYTKVNCFGSWTSLTRFSLCPCVYGELPCQRVSTSSVLVERGDPTES
jgi:hypothetical protein